MSSQSKLLAVCLAFIQKEVARQTESLQTRIPENLAFRDDLEALRESVREQFLKEAFEQTPIKELPDGIVFESHLDDAVESLTESLTKHTSALEHQLVDAESRISESVDALKTEAHDYFGQINEDLEASRKVLREELASTADDLSQKLSALREETSNTYTTLEAAKQLTEALSTTDLNLQGLEQKTAASFEEFSEQLKSLFETTEQKINSLDEQTRDSVKSSVDTLNEQIVDIQGQLVLRIGQIYQELSARTSELETNKADRDHTHDDLAPLLHEHPDLAEKSDVQEVERRVASIKGSVDSVRKTVEQVLEDLKQKANLNQTIQLSDIERVTDEIAARVRQSIPTPTNGQDAHEWEFKWHPTIKGRLMFKRADHKQYAWQDLLVEPKIAPSFGGFSGIGGGGSGAGSLIVSQNGSVVEGRTTEIDFVGAQVEQTAQGRVRVIADALPPFEKVLSAFSVVIPATEHLRLYRPTLEVFNPSGRLVEVEFQVNTENDVTILSNISLDGHLAVIR